MKLAIICPSKDMTCGIGDYSRSLVNALKDKAEVLYSNDINEEVLEFSPDVLNIQWEYGLYDAAGITRSLNIVRRKGIRTSITLHGWSDYDLKNKIIESMFDGYIVLNEGFRQHLRKRGIEKPIHVIPMGMQSYEFGKADRELIRELLGIDLKEPVVGAFGFLELYKNFHTIIETLAQIRGVSFLLCSYSKDPNNSYANELRQLASNLGVKYIRLEGYMSMSSIMKTLHACDALVYPYVDVFTYSSSAAIRTGICSLTPVVARDITFFGDIPDGGPVYKTSDGLANAISKVLTDETLRETLLCNAREYIKKNTWDIVADMYLRCATAKSN